MSIIALGDQIRNIKKREDYENMKISDRMGNILGLLLVIIAIIIQSWSSIFQLEFQFDAGVLLSQSSIVLLITGSVLLATLNINRIFAIFPRINYVIAMIGLVGLSMLLVFRGYLESLLLFPHILIVYFLILDFFWIFFLGLLLKRFQTKVTPRISH